ncbi:glycosyltransferase family 2 protein [Microterricola pindariensis]|uniref:glycosyltransferase family 2 protein n=1 Tax=Microterricola pindariensis TaxID=478010 RepID=UPI001E3F95F4|nr:glycosyltransferase [Microterricola pindariensis]
MFIGIVVILLTGVSTLFWIVIGMLRFVGERLGTHSLAVRPKIRRRGAEEIDSIGLSDVAILLAAHNESAVIARTIRQAAMHVPLAQIHIVSDGSSDDTVAIARAEGAQVLDLNPNRGKAGALVAALEHFEIVKKFKVMVLLDADTHLAPDYLVTGLRLFRDPEVVAVAGRVRTLTSPAPPTRLGRVLVSYRERLYVVLQLFLKYGQAAKRANAIFIVPGFASMYRTRVLPNIDIDPPGLVIEDFNMTFEVHAQRLGRIAFHPRAAVAYTQDPGTIHDYLNQTRRWSLGFWQTVRKHHFQPHVFWVAVGFYIVDITTSAFVYLALLVLLGTTILAQLITTPDAATVLSVDNTMWPGLDLWGTAVAWSNELLSFITPGEVLLVIVLPDYALTLFAALVLGRPKMLFVGVFFPIVRTADAWICLSTLRASRAVGGDGRWVSPARRLDLVSGDTTV